MLDGPIVFDLTRLLTRLKHGHPTGIDRVDLAYALRLLRPGRAPRFGLATTPLGPRLLSGEAARAIVDLAAARWNREDAPTDDPVLAGLRARLRAGGEGGDRPPAVAAAPRAAASAADRLRPFLARARLAAALPLARLPRGALYVHTSHLRLDRPRRFDWLADPARGVRPVFFVHDLIPIEFPEYGRPGEDARHRVRMATIARHARAVIVNSADVGGRYAAHVGGAARSDAPVVVGPLGVERDFLRAAASTSAAPDAGGQRPYFVVCGTIEPRKNVLTLLNVWRDLAARHGPATPGLVLVGRRGWEAENVIDMLERCPAVRAHVVEAPGLSTAGLVGLMRGARALLMPSFAEGYGLPVVEAAALGVAVVASNIPVHREVAGGFAHFLDPLDGRGWAGVVEALAAPGSALGAGLRERLVGFRAPTWEDHFARVEPALAALTEG